MSGFATRRFAAGQGELGQVRNFEAGDTRGPGPRVLVIALCSLVLAGCYGSGGDGDVWDAPEVEAAHSISISERLPPERDGSYEGVFLELSEGWAEVLDLERELAFDEGRIRFSLTVSTEPREWCDLGEMAIRDDVSGERHVFVKEGDCIRKGGSISVRGVFEEGEPLAVQGVTSPVGN